MENSDPSRESKWYKIKDLKVYSSTEYISENKNSTAWYMTSKSLPMYMRSCHFTISHLTSNWDAEVELRCFEKHPENNRFVTWF